MPGERPNRSSDNTSDDYHQPQTTLAQLHERRPHEPERYHEQDEEGDGDVAVDVASGLGEDAHGAEGRGGEQERERPGVAKGSAFEGLPEAQREDEYEDPANDEAGVEQGG